MSDTKENILITALSLFAKDGYEAVSVSMIAGALGMTKGALYKHYKNKRDIFDSIVSRMERHDAERANEFQMPTGPVSHMEEEYLRVTVDRLVEYGKAQFRYWTQDSFASSFRRMLTLEQYRSPEMGRLYQQYLAYGPLGYVADIFGSLGYADPMEKAMGLYGPMFLMYSAYDGAEAKDGIIAAVDSYLEKTGNRLREEKNI